MSYLPIQELCTCGPACLREPLRVSFTAQRRPHQRGNRKLRNISLVVGYLPSLHLVEGQRCVPWTQPGLNCNDVPIVCSGASAHLHTSPLWLVIPLRATTGMMKTLHLHEDSNFQFHHFLWHSNFSCPWESPFFQVFTRKDGTLRVRHLTRKLHDEMQKVQGKLEKLLILPAEWIWKGFFLWL